MTEVTERVLAARSGAAPALARAITHEGVAAGARLARLGLDVEGLSIALELALGDRLACTAFDPPMFAGQTRSARLVRYLREEYVGRRGGWKPEDSSNYSLLLSETGDIAVQVATGNEATGDPSRSPRLAHAKGEMTEKSVNRNAQQLNLFTGEPDEMEVGPTTWVLLVNEHEGGLFAELSLPASFSNGQIDTWAERVILPSRRFGGEGPTVEGGPPGPVSPKPTIQRRTVR
jgi:hypothetical protein